MSVQEETMKVKSVASRLISPLLVLGAVLALSALSAFLATPATAKPPEGVHPDDAKAEERDKGNKDDKCSHLPPAIAAALKKFAKRCPSAGSSTGIGKGDFNGDGFADLAIGVPKENTPSTVTDSGAVIVVYGSASGLTVSDPSVPAPQFWSQNAPGVPGASEGGDTFGSALASGDFNHDGFSDLAIGVPGDAVVKNGVGSIGQVIVIFGSANGLTTSDTTVPAPQSFVICDLPGAGTRILNCQFAASTEADIAREGNFGAALSWGDFDGDGFGDLAIGSPTETLGNINAVDAGIVNGAGAVGILFGSANGLSTTRGQLWTLNASNLPGARAGDRFGSALAGGDFNADGVTDLAIGIPDRDVAGTSSQGGGTISNAGAVLMLLGANNVGLTTTGRRFFDETDLFASGNVGGLSGAGDLFGSALAAGDFDGEGHDDLAIGAHGRAISGQAAAGAVWVQYSSTAGPLSGRIQFWDQSIIFPGSTEISELNAVGSPSESGDHFGFSLAAGDFNADGRDDLAIGVPFETLLVNRGNNVFEHVTNAGEVDVIYGSGVGLSITETRGPQRFTRNSIVVQAGDLFGFSLTAWNFGRNELRRTCSVIIPTLCFTFPVAITDLAIGAPGQAVGAAAGAGVVHVFYGSLATNGLDFSSEQTWTHSNTGTGTSQSGEFFGGALY